MQYIETKNRKLFSECTEAFAAAILDDPIVQGKKQFFLSEYVRPKWPDHSCRAANNNISWKNIFPAQSPFWSDKTEIWSGSIKGSLVVFHENYAWCRRRNRRRGIPRLTVVIIPRGQSVRGHVVQAKKWIDREGLGKCRTWTRQGWLITANHSLQKGLFIYLLLLLFFIIRPFIWPQVIVSFFCEMILFGIHSVRTSCPTHS